MRGAERTSREAVGREDSIRLGNGCQSGWIRAAEGSGVWESGCYGPALQDDGHSHRIQTIPGGYGHPHTHTPPRIRGPQIDSRERLSFYLGHIETKLVRVRTTCHVSRMVTVEKQCERKGKDPLWRTLSSKLKSLHLIHWSWELGYQDSKWPRVYSSQLSGL